ncbi:amino acid ABC transporter permease [Ectothiorhodospiraceae bacterium WFHF3C12]|nr:amino acid ABC transporter permease [Ectothiorhodospiraceae bacterium WFHF3C12]
MIVHNTLSNMREQGIASGFGFLDDTAGFGIAFSLIDYNADSTYARAFLVGLLNTLFVSGVGILLATLLGFIVGIARLSPNWLIRRWAAVFIETFRNIPLLLQIFFWYFAVLRALPAPRESLAMLDLVYLNNRGLQVPKPVLEPGFGWVIALLLAGIAGAWAIAHWARKRRERTGQGFASWPAAAALVIIPPVMAFYAAGNPLDWNVPSLGTFSFSGGMNLIPEFVALLLALAIYTAAFIAEIVRGGVESVPRGQVEAAQSLGLSQRQVMRKVILPQALRVIIPPLTNQYLNLTKNSSLAAAIAYPELVSVFAGTVLNQTGQAVEVIAVTMGVYLTISLSIALVMNWYDRRKALKGA